MLNWVDWYLKTVAVHQGFKNFTFFIYCMWERKPSVCVKLKLSSRISALKKKKIRWVHWSQRLYIGLSCLETSFKFCPSELLQQIAQIRWVFQASWHLANSIYDQSQKAWSNCICSPCSGATHCLKTENCACSTCPLPSEDFSGYFSLKTVAEGSFSNNNISCFKMIRSFMPYWIVHKLTLQVLSIWWYH